MKPSTVLFLIVLLLLVVLTGYIGTKGYVAYQASQKEEEYVAQAIPVHVATIGTGDVEDLIKATGKIEAGERADVLAKIPFPGKLIEARVKKGDDVSLDQVLLTVNRDEVGAQYLAYGVKAPMKGTIAYIQDDKGSIVSAQQPVATILNLSVVKIKTSVIESDLGRVQVGDPVRIQTAAYPDRVFKGSITKIEPVLDELSHTAVAEISISNSDRALKPGMFARLEIVADKKTGVPLVPKVAIMRKQGRDLAFLVKTSEKNKDETRIELTELKLGYYDLENYEVVGGAVEGDRVVDRDLVVFKDQTLVTIETGQEEKASGDETEGNSPDEGAE